MTENALSIYQQFGQLQQAAVFATQAAAKKLGFKAVPKDAKARLNMYQAIKAHAVKRNAEEAAAEQNELFPDAENGAYQD